MNNQTKFVYNKVIEDPNIRSILNIGYRFDSDPTIMNYSYANHKKWSVLEVFEPNFDILIQNGINAYCLDAMDIDKLEESYDAVIWLHGPEHVTWDKFLLIDKKIEEKATRLVLYQAPIGEYPQDAIYGNPYERHVNTLYPEMFAELGYVTYSHEKEGEKTFSAWKYKN